jgi:hypothetical protein
VCALVTSILSLRLVGRAVTAVIKDGEDIAIIKGAEHLYRDQLLLVICWAVLLVVGILGAADTPATPTAPPSFIGTLSLYLLIIAFGILAYKTIVDYLYTRSIWQRRSESSSDETA